VLDVLKNLLYMNFVIMVLLENSLQFILFSVINLLDFRNLHSPSAWCSYLISAMLLFSITLIVALNIQRVRTGHLDDPKFSAIFELLKPQSKPALLYHSVFVLRRLLLALTLVFMKDSQVSQISLLIGISLAYSLYLIRVRPFD
jgi:hypothetical protein